MSTTKKLVNVLPPGLRLDLYEGLRERPRTSAWNPGHFELTSLVKTAYEFWVRNNQIPSEIMDKIERFTLTPSEFYDVFNTETPSGSAIELIDGKIRFRTNPIAPNGNITREMARQINSQDKPPILAGDVSNSTPVSFCSSTN